MIKTAKRFLSPAKVNLRLDVLGKREDGYHEIESIMTRVSLYDEVLLTIDDGLGVEVNSTGLAPSGAGNIGYKAAKAILDLIPQPVKVKIDITKNIPVAAGLGGGSSNAATVLMGLNEMLDAGLSKSGLMKIGVRLGADVPFFIFERPAIARGIGEKLEEVMLPKLWLVLVNPNISVSTADIYRGLNLKIGLTKGSINNNMSNFKIGAAEVVSILHNDLEDVALKMYPEIGLVKDTVGSAGAGGVLMSGSGSTVFGVFDSYKSAEDAFLSLTAKETGWRIFLAESI